MRGKRVTHLLMSIYVTMVLYRVIYHGHGPDGNGAAESWPRVLSRLCLIGQHEQQHGKEMQNAAAHHE